MTPLIKVEALSYAYRTPGEESPAAVRDISLQVEAGELVALIGANGSGKTTLARLMKALLVPDQGRVLVDGMDTRSPANRGAIHRTLGMVFQSPEDQVIATTVEEDVAFGPENLGLPPKEIRGRVEAALKEVNLWEARQRPPHLLSAGQMQRLALAGVLALRPRGIIFDEATAMLDPAGRRYALEMMRRLAQEGVAVIFITHFMDEAVQAGRVMVLDHGRVALDGPPETVFADERALAAMGLELPPAGRLANRLRQVIPSLPAGLLTAADLVKALASQSLRIANSGGGLEPVPEDQAEPAALVEVNGLGHVYLAGTPLAQRALDGVSLSVGSGQSLGLLGATGSGKSTLLQHLNGLLRPQEGDVRVAGFNLNDRSIPLKSVIRKVGLVFQNPESQFFEQYVGDEIAFGPRQLPSGEPLSQRVKWAMGLVGLDFEGFKDRLTFTLSGGERRKVALASVLALKPSLLLMDEPTAGLDPASERDLLARLEDLQKEGLNLILSSHQMEVILALATHLTAMHAGRDVLTGTTRSVFSQPDKLRAYGLEPPVMVQVVEGLNALGWQLPFGMINPDDLAGAIGSLSAG